MSSTPQFAPLLTAYGWMVSVPSSMSGDGRRRKKYFPTETEAKKFAGRLRASWLSGVRNAVMPAEVARQAMEAMRVLDGSGISLIEAARMAADTLKEDHGSELFADRLARCITAGERYWSARYATDMGSVSRWVAPWLMEMRCGAITQDVVRRALVDGRPLAQSTIEARSSRVMAVLGHKVKHRKSSEIRILTKQECRALLRACECRAEVWAVALLLFAGVRPDAEMGEIRRLRWEDVRDTEIYISGPVSKTGADRHVPVLPRLGRLLRGRPAVGAVTPANWRRVWRRIRVTAGIADTQDACRHTFASMLLAWHEGDEGKVKLAMGHTAGSATLFRHYRRAVTAEEGKKFFR